MKTIKGFFNLFLVVTCLLIPARSSSLEDWIEQGLSLSKSKRFGEAIQAFSKAIEANPRDTNALYHRGSARYYKGDYAQAIADYTKALDIDPNFADAWCGIANTYHRELFSGWSDNPEEAKIKLLDAARRAVALDDGNADAHHCLSFGYMNNGQPAEAVAAAERAVDLSPINPQSHNRLGAILALAGRPEEGVLVMQTGIRLNPRHPRVHLHRALLARAHLDAHQYEEAADQARQAIQRGRVYLDEHLTLASALGHLGRGEEAIAVLNQMEEYKDLRISEIVLCPWWQLYQDSGPNEHLFDGLRKAGIPE